MDHMLKECDFASGRWKALYCFFSLLCFTLVTLGAVDETNLVDRIIGQLYSGQTVVAAKSLQELQDINAKSSNGSPLLVEMAKVPGLRDPILFDEVFKRHPNCNLRGSEKQTALYFAASVGNSELVDRLIQCGADPNADSNVGSALVAAAWNNRHQIALRLLQIPHIKVDTADHEGNTALMYAVIHLDLELSRELLAKGAKPNIYETTFGNTPLIWSVKGSKELVALLLNSGADSGLANPVNCRTVLHAAVAADNEDVVRFLLDRNVNPSSLDSHGQTPLGIAVEHKNSGIAQILNNALKSRGMNLTATGAANDACHSDRLVTYARPGRSPFLPPEEPAAGEFLPLIKAVVAKWEAQNNIFIEPDVPGKLSYQVDLFRWIVCSPRGNKSRDVINCRALLANKAQLSSFIVRNLNENFVEKKHITTGLAALLSASIGVNFGHAYPISRDENDISCVQLPPDYVNSEAQFVGPDALIALRPRVKFCLSQGTYDVLVPSKGVQLRLDFKADATGLMTSVSPVTPASEMLLASRLIEAPTDVVDLQEAAAHSPLTKPLPRRDDVLIEVPEKFSTVTSIEISIKDDSHLCDDDCQIALKVLLIKAVAVWKAGCSRCSLANLLLLRFDNVSYFNVQTVDVLDTYARRKADWPSATNKQLVSQSTGFHGYEMLEQANPKISGICQLKVPDPFDALCRNGSPSNQMKLILEVSTKTDTCRISNAIACATPDGVIQLRAFDKSFVVRRPFDLPALRFGSGPKQFDLLMVLIHELGHFFGVPHVDDATPKIGGKSDVMSAGYDPHGFWVTSADYAMVNQAVDPKWPFRLDGCAGLKEGR